MTAGPPPPAPRSPGDIVLVRSLTKAQLGEPRTYYNVRFLLAAAAAAPIPATKKLGNLTRASVERAFAEMHWQADEAEMVRFHNKAIDEPDLGSLWLLRVAAQNGGLLRRYRGAFTTKWRDRTWATAFEQLCDTIAHRLLRHMEDFGLVTMAPRTTGLDRYRSWPERSVRVTPVFTRFVVPAPGSPRFN